MERLIEDRDRLLRKLSDYAGILRGTIVRRGNICGKKGCRCKRPHHPLPHGPYHYLSHRGRQKTQMVFLNKTKLRLARRGIKEYRELIAVIYRISEINFRILRYHYRRLKEKDT